MRKPLAVMGFMAVATCMLHADTPSVTVEPTHLQGPRPLVEQTQTGVVRDYLQAWQSMATALEQNRAELLDPAFIGTARQKLTDTIQEQSKIGVTTHYQDRSHDIQIVFYSPEGLSIQLIDNVQYDVEVSVQGKAATTQHVQARYVVVLTPAEVRWRVRILQAAEGQAAAGAQ